MRTLLIFSFLFLCQVSVKTQKLKLDPLRKYQNLLIHISNKVEENEGKLLDSIKEQVTLASQALYKATNNMDKSKHGVKFGTIYINVPNHWNISAPPATWQNSKRAHFKILTKDDNKDSDRPFTFQSKECGRSGKYIRFPGSFFNNGRDPSRNGKEIMREFVKFRFGVFSEEPYKNILFVHNGTHFINNSCNHNIEWEVNKSPEVCSDKNSICKYKIKEGQNHNYSVMFDTETASSQFFCNDKDRPHNPLAYNHQNKFCKGQSITTVILRHEDFKKRSRGVNEYEPPTFKIVKQPGRKIVFVLDTSGSMHDALYSMKSAVQMFINTTVEPSAEIGLVTFKDVAKTLSLLVKMDNSEQKMLLAAKLNDLSSFGFSNITGGLTEAIGIFSLQPREKRSEFESIILITDGESFTGESSNNNKSQEAILKSRVAVNVILIGEDSNSKLKGLSKLTGGKFYDTDGKESTDEVLGRLKLIREYNEKVKYRKKKYGKSKYGKKKYGGKKYGGKKYGGKKYGGKKGGGKKYGGKKYGGKKDSGKKDSGKKYGGKKYGGKKYGGKKYGGKKYGGKKDSGKKDSGKKDSGKKYGGKKYGGKKYGKKKNGEKKNDKKKYGEMKNGKEEKLKIVSEFTLSTFEYFVESIENDTKIRIEFAKNMSEFDVQLLDPSKIPFTYESVLDTENSTKFIFRIPEEPKPGTYNLEILHRPRKRAKRSIENMNTISNMKNGIPKLKCKISPTKIDMVNRDTVVTLSLDLSKYRIIGLHPLFVDVLVMWPTSILGVRRMTDDGIGDDSVKGDRIFTKKLFFKDLHFKGSYIFIGRISFSNSINSTSEITSERVEFEELLVKDVNKSALVYKVLPFKLRKPVIHVIHVEAKVIELETVVIENDVPDRKIDKYDIQISSSMGKETIRVTEESEFATIFTTSDRVQILLYKKDITSQKQFEVSIRGVDESNIAGEWSEKTFVQL